MKVKVIILPTAVEPYKMPYYKHIPKSDIVLGLVDSLKYSKGLGFTKDRGTIDNFSKEMYQHIYLTYPEAKIEDKNWYIDDINRVRQAVTSDSWYWESRKSYNKIVCSTNKSLLINIGGDTLPQLSEQSIKLLIDYYNENGNMPDEVEVVYKDIPEFKINSTKRDAVWENSFLNNTAQCIPEVIKEINTNKYFQLKYRVDLYPGYYDMIEVNNPQGLIDITIPEEKMYSREDMNEFAAWYVDNTGRYSSDSLALKQGEYLNIWIKETLK